jgi:TonB-dependent receptor
MTRLTFMVIMLTSTLTGVLLAREVKSQNISRTKVSIDMNRAELREVFLQLEKQSGFRFYYDHDIGSIKDVTLKENAALDVVLKKLANLKHLRFTQQNRLIAVTKSPLPVPPPPTGSIKGRIVEFETAEPLPGASIRLLELNKGISSDNNGYYEMVNIPAGKYTLQVTYVGFKTEKIQVEIKEGKETTYDVKLQGDNKLNEVVIDGSRTRIRSVAATTDKDLLKEIKQATGVVSGIANEQIVKSADRNAAEIVKRISGVSVVDDRFIVVRGMNERYNLTYLNNNLAPTTELYNKAFAYDLLPSSIIDRILVYKSPQADLFADFAGGAIKTYTKNARPVRHLDVGVQVAHRPGSTLTDVNSYKGGKYDFLGFDDGTRKLPSFSPNYFQSNQNTRLTDQSILLEGFSPTLDYGTKKSTPDMQFYINYYDNWKIGKARLYDLTAINYTHETRDYNIYNQTGNTYVFLAGGGDLNLNVNNTIINSRQTTEISKVNVLENLTLKLNKNNQLEFKNFFVNEGRKLTTVNDSRRNIEPSIDSAAYGDVHQHNINLSFQQRLLYSGNLGGEHDFQNKKQHLDWNLGYSYTLQSVPDQRNSSFANYGHAGPGYVANGSNVGTSDAGFLGMINRLFIRLNENAYNASVDYIHHLNTQFTLKAGIYQLYKTREVGRRFFRVNRAGLQPNEVYIPANENANDGWIENYGVSNPNLIFFRQSDLGNVWSNKYFPNDGSGLAIYDVTSPVDSYVASEQNNSGYLMGDWTPIEKKLTVNAGLRVEYDHQKVSGATGSDGTITAVKADHPKTSFLPSFNINYKPDTAYAIRIGYGRTVNRPDFRELAPYNDFDFQNNQTILGNPDLTSATIDNYDFRAEFYPQSAQQNEVFNAGVFYKSLENPIEQLRVSKSGYNDVSNFTNITYGNAISAKVYGIEAELKKSLSFVPLTLFRDLSVIANGALIKSTTQQRDYSGGNYAIAGSNIKGRPLQGQSPYVLNAGLYYENAGSGTKISLIYNVSGARIYAKSSGNPNSVKKESDSTAFKAIRPDLLQLPQKLLDISITQRVVKSLQVKFSVQNILNQAFTIVEDHNYNQKYDPEKPVKNTDPNGVSAGKTYYLGDNIFQRYNPGRYFIAQFTYAF